VTTKSADVGQPLLPIDRRSNSRSGEGSSQASDRSGTTPTCAEPFARADSLWRCRSRSAVAEPERCGSPFLFDRVKNYLRENRARSDRAKGRFNCIASGIIRERCRDQPLARIKNLHKIHRLRSSGGRDFALPNPHILLTKNGRLPAPAASRQCGPSLSTLLTPRPEHLLRFLDRDHQRHWLDRRRPEAPVLVKGLRLI
jgi:hypothetical protein